MFSLTTGTQEYHRTTYVFTSSALIQTLSSIGLDYGNQSVFDDQREVKLRTKPTPVRDGISTSPEKW